MAGRKGGGGHGHGASSPASIVVVILLAGLLLTVSLVFGLGHHTGGSIGMIRY